MLVDPAARFADPEQAGQAEAAAGIITKAFSAMLEAKLAADPKQTALTQIVAVKAEQVTWATVEEYEVAMAAIKATALEAEEILPKG